MKNLSQDQINQNILKNIKSLSDQELIAQAQKSADQERAYCVQVLHHLMVIEERRLYALRGYGSLFEFVVKELKYSDGAAYRRIQAMRLMKGTPEVRSKIQSGTLSLTNAAQVQKFMRTERKQKKKIYTPQERSQLIQKVENQSTRGCEKTLRDISPLSVPQEKERVLSSQETEIKFVADEELLKKLEEIKQLLSHTHPDPSYKELFHDMADRSLKVLRKQKGISSTSAPTVRCVNAQESKKQKTDQNKASRRRSASHPLKREIRQRDQNECTYRDPLTGRTCRSKHQLELDHRKPYALGGRTEASNLRLLCREHNQLMAVEKLGREVMKPFFEG